MKTGAERGCSCATMKKNRPCCRSGHAPFAPSPKQEQKQFAVYRDITPGYFRTLGIPLLQGRDFNEQDTENTAGVVIINGIMAQTFWPSEPSAM
jgi:hypothetical protein